MTKYQTFKVFRIFIASPSDLAEERFALNEIINEVNKYAGNVAGWHIELMGWEDALAQGNRPQSVINEDVDRCDMFIGLLWKRWGTPTGGIRSYSSGFEEEFESAIGRKKTSGQPDIKMYFKKIEDAHLTDPDQQLSRVRKFRKNLESDKKVLFGQFDNIDDWKRLVTRIANEKILELTKKSEEKSQNQIANLPEIKSEEPKAIISGGPNSDDYILAIEDLVENKGANSLSALNVARLELLVSYLVSQKFSFSIVDTHTAHELNENRRSITLRSFEKVHLLKSGLSDSGSVIAFWYLIKNHSAKTQKKYLVEILNTKDAGDIRKNVILILEKYNIRVPSSSKQRAILLDKLLESNQLEALTYIEYLGKLGIRSDLPTIDKIIAQKQDYLVSSAAENAKTNILVGLSFDKALKAVLKAKTVVNDNFKESFL